MLRPALEAAAMNLRTATTMAGLRVPPRVKRIPAVRRRLPIMMLPEMTQPVIIRHAGQNLGSAVSGAKILQAPRV